MLLSIKTCARVRMIHAFHMYGVYGILYIYKYISNIKYIPMKSSEQLT